ncbi:MAG TPA: hypothetical protein VGF28_14580 [Thermoanaerobaculia bacterium]|jgi:hypothetical protein
MNEGSTALIPISDLKVMAAEVAEELRSAGTPVTGPLRAHFITVRANLFQRGIYDPVLVRFDSATAPRATTEEVAEQLAAVANAL